MAERQREIDTFEQNSREQSIQSKYIFVGGTLYVNCSGRNILNYISNEGKLHISFSNTHSSYYNNCLTAVEKEEETNSDCSIFMH